MKQYLENLNKVQLEAVTSDKQYNLVLAGAGSGKTRVLIQRLIYLIEERNVPKNAIMMVTFTNKAAREMKDRAQKMLKDSIQQVWIGTFHAICLRMLRQNPDLANLTKDFQIINNDDKKQILRRIIVGEGLDPETTTPDAVGSYISKCKQNRYRSEHINVTNVKFKEIKKLYELYEESNQKTNVIDFDEILLRCLEMLEQNKELLDKFHQQFSHLLIDEFQDTNTVQFDWLKLIAGQNTSLMIVGDDDQSIYGWRGANIQNMLDFTKNFENVKTFRLEQNYRSTGNIIAAANAIVSTNTDRLAKKLWTGAQKGNKIDIIKSRDEKQEAQTIVTYIEKYVQSKSDAKFRDVAILYRINSLSRNIEETFLSNNIPYQVYGGVRFYDRQEIRYALGYLRVAVNDEDDVAFDRVINFPPRGIGKTAKDNIKNIAKEHKCSLFQALKIGLDGEKFTKKVTENIKHFMQLIDKLKALAQTNQMQKIVQYLLDESGLMEYYQNAKKEVNESRIANLKELLNSIQQFKQNTDVSLDRSMLEIFLESVSLDSGDESVDFEDCVQMMTVHSAKGLEFPLVIICGFEQGIFPYIKSVSENNLSEETRLCYVAVTRAKQQLMLSYTENRNYYGSAMKAYPSEYIQHIPHEIRNIEQPINKNYNINPRVANTRSKLNPPEDGLPKIGTRVHHTIFGPGIIVDYEGRKDKIIIINFDSDRKEKRFSYEIAKANITY